jgi:glycine/D-amino acid oxidase-like deaminating enzyme
VVITNAGEELRAAKCVVTVGAWTSKLLLSSVAGVDLPIHALRTSVLYWRIKRGRERDRVAGPASRRSPATATQGLRHAARQKLQNSKVYMLNYQCTAVEIVAVPHKNHTATQALIVVEMIQ